MKALRSLLPFAVLASCLAFPAKAQTVMFDFDTATPALTSGRSTPFDQTSGGVTATFSSPSGPAFSVQNATTNPGTKLSQFSGNYLYPNDLNRNVLVIKFSQPLSAISMKFATADFHQVEVPTTIQLTAYQDVNTNPAIGVATAHGTYASDTMPMGTLTFNSGTQTFNLVEIVLPPQPLAAADFLVDNVLVTLANAGNFANVSAASYAAGAPMAPGSIASGFGQGLASGSDSALSTTLPTTLANTTVSVKDSTGTTRLAPLFYVGPTQVNYLVPDASATGPATITVTSAGQVTATGSVTIDLVAPGLFTANFDGKGVPAANAITVAPDLSQTLQAVAQCGANPGSCVTSPLDLGPAGTQVVLVLYGTGIRGRSALSGVKASIKGVDSQVQYAGAQSQYPGLDQVNVAIPRSLAGAGEVDLVLTVDGKAANTVRVNIK